MKIRLNRIYTAKKKAYSIKEGQLYIDGEQQGLDFLDESVASYDVSENEDYQAITRDAETKEVTVFLNVFTDWETKKAVFTINKTDALFPYERNDKGRLVMESTLEELEGLEW